MISFSTLDSGVETNGPESVQPPPKSGRPASASEPPLDAPFTLLEREYVVYFLRRFPVVATYLGGSTFDAALAEVDGALRDFSPSALAEEDAKLGQFKDLFLACDDTKLNPRQRIDRRVALAQIEFLLHQHQIRRHQERSLDSFVEEPFYGVDWQIQAMTSTGQSSLGTTEEWQRLVERLRAVPAYLDNALVQLVAGIAADNTPDWRVLMLSGLETSLANREYFRKTLQNLGETYISGSKRTSLLRELRAAGHQASDAYRKFRDHIIHLFFADVNRLDATGLKAEYRGDRYALGVNEYNWALHNNLGIHESAEELYKTSWKAVECTREEMIVLAKEIAAAHKWQISANEHEVVGLVFYHLTVDAPKSDSEMLEAYEQVGKRLVAYARRTSLFNIPDEYELEVAETPPPLRSSFEAAYFPSPPFKGVCTGRFFITPTGDDMELLRLQHNHSAIAYVAAHEGVPGHDWHYKVMAQYGTEISPIRWLSPGGVGDSSSMWADAIASEGWGLYSEGLMAESRPEAPHGFYSPEERLHQLRGLLYRNLRVRIDTGLHTGRLGFEEAVSLFSETLDFLKGSCADATVLRNPAKCASCKAARAAVTRYSRWPTQAITYRIGKDQILALRERARAELGAGYSEQRFHLEFMKRGLIPPSYFADELIEALKQRE